MGVLSSFHVKNGLIDTEYLSMIQNTILTKERVSIAPMDSREIQHNLKEKGKRPAPIRQDGEQPLACFSDKNPEYKAKKSRHSFTANIVEKALSIVSYVGKPLTYAFNTAFLVDTARRFTTAESTPTTYKSLSVTKQKR